MSIDQLGTSRPPRRRRVAVTLSLLGAGAAAGVIGATAFGAGAQSTTTTTATMSPPTASSTPGYGHPNGPGGPANAPAGHGGATPIRSDEHSLSANLTATLRAEALKAVPGGTVYRVESDAGDGVYEAHMTKADGTLVTVKFNKDLKVVKVEAGMGSGDPAPRGAPPMNH